MGVLPVGLAALALASGCTAIGYPEPAAEVGPERCVNGIDDDLDGMTDCEVASCDGYCPALPAAPIDGPNVSCPPAALDTGPWSTIATLLEGTRADGSTWSARWCARGPRGCRIPDVADEYVDATAAPGGDGSRERPHRTIAEGLLGIDGGTVVVRPGTYAERVRIATEVAIVGDCTGTVTWTAPDDDPEPIVRVAQAGPPGTLVFLRGLELAPRAGPAIFVETAGTLDLTQSAIRGSGTLAVVDISATLQMDDVDIETTGEVPAVRGQPGATIAIGNATLAAPTSAIAVDSGALELTNVELRGAVSVSGATSRLTADQVFADGIDVNVARGRAEISGSVFRGDAMLVVTGRAEVLRTAFATGARLHASGNEAIDLSAVAFEGTSCVVFSTADELSIEDAWVFGAPIVPAPDVPTALVCIAAGSATLSRVVIDDAAATAIQVGGLDEPPFAAARLSDVVIERACSGGCNELDGAIRVGFDGAAWLDRIRIARTDGCAVRWATGTSIWSDDGFVIERNRVGLCGPDAAMVASDGVFVENEADLEAAPFCVPDRSRACRTPFAG